MDDIDVNRHAYLSYQKLSELVTTVVAPVMEKISAATEQGKKHAVQLVELSKASEEQERDLGGLKRTVKQIEDLQRSHWQLDGELRIARTQAEAVERQAATTAETVRTELAKVQKQFAATDDQLKQFRQQVLLFDRKIADWKDCQQEAQHMHNEDISQRVAALRERI